MNDPKPVVVGIAWVVECVEQRSRVDEAKFKVDLELVNVAGTNKVGSGQHCASCLMCSISQRRRSMLPKHMSPLSNALGTCYIPANLSSDDSGKRHPPDGDGSPGALPRHFLRLFTHSTLQHKTQIQVSDLRKTTMTFHH